MKRNEKGQFVKTHGHWVGNKPHFLYATWQAMKKRCFKSTDKDFKRYGARGITVCERWLDFGKFVEDLVPGWRPGLTIGRIDNNGNYEPSNCRWETQKQQHNNRRDSTHIEFMGKVQTVPQWCDALGLPLSRVKNRLRRKLPIERVFEPRNLREC